MAINKNSLMQGNTLDSMLGLALPIVPMKQNHEIYFSNVQEGPFLNEHISAIFSICLSTCEWKSIGAFIRVNKQHYQCATVFWEQFDLKLCNGLTVLDAKTLGITVDDEPCINKLKVLKCFKKLASQVENNEGMTLLTMAKGLTMRTMVDVASRIGLTLVFKSEDLPIEQTYVILITNGVFKGSLNKVYGQQKELVAGHGCLMPSLKEYVALYVFTHKVFGKTLSFNARSSTHRGGIPLIVRSIPPKSLQIFRNGFAYENVGAGGRKK